MRSLRVIVLLSAVALQPASAQVPEGFWKLEQPYTDTVNGVTFLYPKAWIAGDQWGYHPPAITAYDKKAVTSGFGFEAGGFAAGSARREPYAQSNVEGFGIIYSATAKPDAAACNRFTRTVVQDGSEEPAAPRRVTLGGVRYSQWRYSEPGMSQLTTGRLYATYRSGTCYLFELDVSTSNAAAEERQWPAAKANDLQNRLRRIMETVRFQR